MSKVKQWAEDTAEQSVDKIISKLKDGQIDLDTAKNMIMKVDKIKPICSSAISSAHCFTFDIM